MDLYASTSFQSMRQSASAMIGPRKLVDYIRRPAEELFDMEADPDEINNLASDPAYADVLLSMRLEVETWQKVTGDLWLWRDDHAVITIALDDFFDLLGWVKLNGMHDI
ncbi:hypothetical protein B0I35DRAFT_405988 [Stachybotrys elegans]|uniref:N-sulphoglucosamine sulphohydrolase C-terminal domain-containing protein n=1 Tax=Stachybotrys elegans TaxID=80388 RepID=A0A8K0SSS4_9HYPO|nr:hypothetical protein B0I35DRAFT_405988 [Stachybotrys elegans]